MWTEWPHKGKKKESSRQQFKQGGEKNLANMDPSNYFNAQIFVQK